MHFVLQDVTRVQSSDIRMNFRIILNNKCVAALTHFSGLQRDKRNGAAVSKVNIKSFAAVFEKFGIINLGRSKF